MGAIRNILKRNKSIIKALFKYALILTFLFTSINYSFAQTNTWDGSTSANWNTASNWSLNLVPTAAHDVVIPDGITATITVNTAAVCNSFTMNGGGSANTVQISVGNSLTVTNVVSIGGGTGNGDNKILNVGSSTLTCASIEIATTGHGNADSYITLSTGTINVSGNITMNGDAGSNMITFTGAGTLNVGGNITGGSITPSTGTINFNGTTGNQNVGGYTFYNVNFSNGATKTLQGNITARTVTVAANSNLYCEGYTITESVNPSTFTLNAGATLGIGHAGGIAAAGTADGNIRLDTRTYNTGANYFYNGAVAQATGNGLPASVNNLTLNNSSTGVTLTADVAVSGVLDCQQGPFIITGRTLTLAGTTVRDGAGTGTISSTTGNVTVNGTGDFGTLYFTPGSQTVATFTLNRGSNGIVGIGSDLTLSGNLVKTQGVLDIGNNTLTLNLNTAVCGAGTGVVVGGATSTVVVGTPAAGAANIPSLSVGNLTINRTAGVTMCGNTTVNGTLTLTAGNFTIGANTLTLNGAAIAGTATNLVGGATSSLAFGGSSAGVNIPSSITALNNLTIGNTSGIGINSSITLSGVLTLEAGLLSLGNFNLTIGAAGSVGGVPSSSAMVVTNGTGQFFRTVTTTVPNTYLFPIGDNTSGADYSPVNLNFSANNTQFTVGVRVIDAVHPQYQSNGAQIDYLSRYWIFTTGAAGNYTYTGDFTYVPADINGIEANIKVNRYNTSWFPIVSGASSNTMSLLANLTQANGILNGSDFTGRVNPSTTYTWNQTGTASYATAANWTPNRTTPQITDILQFNNGATTVCTNVPTETVNQIIVSGNTNVSLQAAAASNVLTVSGGTGTNLDVQNGSTLQLSGANAFTMNFLPATQNVTIAGSLIVGAGITYNATNSNTVVTGSITNAGTLTSVASNLNFNSGSTYNHNYTTTAGTIPTATWHTNSTLAFIGYTTNTTAPAGLNQDFGNLLWNCTSQTSNLNLNAGLTNVTGNFTVQSTNSGSVRLTQASILNALTIGNNLVLNGGTLHLTGGASASTINILGNLNIIGGTLNLSSSTGAGTINLYGDFSISGGTITETNTATTDINFTGSATQLFTKSAGTISNTVNFYVLSGAILDMGNNVLDGAGATFSLNAGATLISGHQGGIYAAGTADGNVQTLTRNYNPAANYNFNYSGAGTQSIGDGFTAGADVFINSANGAVLTSNTAISGTLTLNQPLDISGRTLTLNGPAIAGTATNLVVSNTTNLLFGGSASGVFIPSSASTLNNLTINNTNGVSLTGNVTLSAAGVLTITTGNLYLGDYNFTTTTVVSGAPFSASKMINTNGTGSFIKAGSVTGDFLTTYPVGTTGYYSPMVIGTLAATTGSGTIAVRAVPSRHSYVPFVNDALLKYWVVSATGLAGITDVRLTFDYNAGEVVGNSSLYVPRLWDGSSYVTLTGATAAGVDPFGINAAGNTYLSGEWTAIDPQTRISFYSYQNGNWNDFNTWTLDPSASLYTNPSNLSPTANDKVQVNTGHTVTMPVGLNNQGANSLKVEGTLDLAATTGHTFTYLSGNGRIRISTADIFPTTTTNTFFTTDEGTVEYYGNSFDLTVARDIYHLEVNMTSGQTLTLLATPYNLGGNLTVKRGTFRINNNAATTKLRLTVQKDINVSTGASFTVGQGNTLDGTENNTGALQFYLVYHSIDCYGNFVNNGTVQFTNQATPVYNATTNTGAISLFMKGASDNSLTCNGTTNLYNLVVDKGTDQSYILTAYASAEGNFRLYGRNNLERNGAAPFTTENPELRKALWIRNGTLKLTGYIFIPSLTESGGDYYIPANGKLWLDGTNVKVWGTDRTEPGVSVGGIQGTGVNTTNGGSQSFSIYGDLRVSRGFFTTGSHGIVLWYQATTFGGILVEGGQLDLPGIRTATGSTAGKFSFTQTGGLIRFLGDNGNENMENYASLCIRGTDPTFTMTGGTMEFYDGQAGANTAGTPQGGIIRIETNESNISVTGGTVSIINNNAASNNFTIYTTAPFYNLHLTGAAATNLTTNINTAIVVKNNMVINDYSTLDVTASNYNVTIGGNFTLGNTTTTNNAVYNSRSNTTTFNGDQNSTITVANINAPVPLTFYDLTIDKTPTSSLATAWSVTLSSPGRTETAGDANNHMVTVTRDVFINEGKWNNYRFKTRVQRHITNYGTILSDNTEPGRITLETGSVRHQLTGSTSTINSFGNIELNNANGAQLNTNISTENFILNAGLIDIQTYNLAISVAFSGSGGYSTTKMIQSLGSASSQGVTVSFTLSGNYVNQDILLMPVGVVGTVSGTGVKYTPLTINLNGDVGAGPFTGTVNIRPVDEYHPTGDPNKTTDQIRYYWKTTVNGNLSSITSTMVNYSFYSSYDFGYGGGKKECYYRDNDWTEGDAAANPLVFSGTGFFTTDYTAGKRLAFRLPQFLYSRQSGNWESTSTWSLTGHGVTNPPTTINSFDVYQIGGFGTVNHQVTKAVSGATPTTVTASKVIILSKTETGITNDPPPSLIVAAGTINHDFNLVTGGGRFVLNDGTMPGGDYLDFVYNDEAIFEYSGGSYTIPATLALYPTLWISGNASSNKTMPNAGILVRKNLRIHDRTNTGVTLTLANTANGNITVNDSLILDNASKLIFQNTGTNRTVTVLKNINCVTGGETEVNSIEIPAGGAFSTPTHQLVVQGDIRMGASTMLLWNSNAQKTVDLVLNGETNSRIYDYAGGVIRLSKLTVNKSATTLTSIIDNAITVNAVTNAAAKPLDLQQGILRINNASTSLELSSGGGNYTIPSTASLILDQGTLSVRGNSTGITLNGLLEINGGTVSVYNAANTNNYIQYTSSGNAQINITGGLLRVGAQIRRVTTSTGGALIYNQTGGTVEIGYRDAPTANRGMLEVLNTGSSFTYTGGSLTIFTAPASATSPALYIDPTTSNIGASTLITLGGLAGSPQIGIYSSVAIPNIAVSGTGTPTAIMWSVPLTINGNLTINSGGAFDANGLQLNIKGNFVNSGSFAANSNTTVFNGTSTQSITGATTFYNLTKSATNLVNVNSNITISNNLRVEAGTLADNGNTLRVLKNAYNAGTITYGGSVNSSIQLGLHMNGTVQQSVSGSGTFGKITVDNANGVYLPIGSSILITNALRLVQGLFDIQGNLLALGVNCAIEGSGFNAFKMIQTNISFTDNGVKKTLPAGAQTFTFPIGSMGKYTPLTLNITDNANSTGSITLKAASEIHPSIIDDTETGCQLNDLNNVLQFYWILRSSGISGFSGTASFKAIPTDIAVSNSCGLTSADYITARLLLSSILWNKFTSDKFDEGTGELEFDFNLTNDDGISGDYLAGLDVAIPNTVTVYQTINNGDWTNQTIWETVPAGGPIPAGGPRGAVVYINPAHTVTVAANRDVFSYKSFVNGTLDLASTTQHRLGYVFGTGTIKLYNTATLPAGDYTGTDGFFTATGGTLEYDGNTDYDVLSGIPSLRNVTFSGTGKRNLPNIVAGLLLYGNLSIQGPTVENYYDRDIEIRGNLVMTSGIYTARTGGGSPKISMTGTNAQIINGSFTAANSSALYNLVVNKSSNGVTLNSAIEVSNFLTLTSGNITTTSANLLTLTNYLQTAITGGSASSYINGPLRKKIDNGDSFVYPIGKGARYGYASVLTAQSTVTDFYWTAEYFNTGFGTYTVNAPLNSVSSTEYWKINSPVDGYTGTVKIRWDNNSDVTPLTVTGGYTNIRVAEYNGTDWVAKTSTNQTNNNYNGTVETSSGIAINTASNPQYYTLGSIAAILAKAYFTTLDAVCDGLSIPVSFSGVTSGDLRYVLSYSIDGNPPIDVTVTSLPYSLPTSGDGLYRLTGFTYRNPPHAGPIVTGVVDNSDVTVNPAPAQPTITPIDGDPSLTFCEGGSVILTSSAGDTYLWSNSETTQNINVNASGSYTVQVTNAFGCYSPVSAAKVVTVNPLPVFTPSAVPGTICFGESSQLDANFVGGTYLWDPIAELDDETIETPLYTPATNPTTPTQVTKTFTVTVTDSNGCTDSGSVNVIVNRTPETGPQYHISNEWP